MLLFMYPQYMYIYLCVRSHVAIEIFYFWIRLHYLYTYIGNYAIINIKKDFK